MFGLGFQELVVIAVLVLMFFPADDLPELMRSAGRWYARMRRASDELRRAFNAEVARAESEYRLEDLRTRREAAARARQDAASAEADAAPPADAAVPLPNAPAGRSVTPPLSPTDPRLRGGVPLDQRDEDDTTLPLDAAPRPLPPDAAPRPRAAGAVAAPPATAPTAADAQNEPRES